MVSSALIFQNAIKSISQQQQKPKPKTFFYQNPNSISFKPRCMTVTSKYVPSLSSTDTKIGNGELEASKVITSSDVRVASSSSTLPVTLGRYLARRLVQIGVVDVFSVPGDSNLVLLDHLIAEPRLTNIGCCNELNAGYAADGYARSCGVGACVVTFTVGGLSLLNAIAEAYSENLSVICIVEDRIPMTMEPSRLTIFFTILSGYLISAKS